MLLDFLPFLRLRWCFNENRWSAQLLDAADRAKSLAAERAFRHNAVECGEAMSQRLPADPTTPPRSPPIHPHAPR
jgi:hypothetical protein